MNNDGYPDPTAERAIANVMRRQRKMELEQTITLMMSPYYKDRFKAEYYQLKIRYGKLRAIIDDWDDLKFEPKCDKETLITQLDSMKAYLSILELRARIEGIELNGNL